MIVSWEDAAWTFEGKDWLMAISDDTPLTGVLAGHPFLHGLPDDLLEVLAAASRIDRFESGSTILAEGTGADAFYLILDGAVAVEVRHGLGRPKVIESLMDGDMLGWSWLIPPYMWAFDASARTPVRAVVVDAKAIRERMETDDRLAHALFARVLPVMANRLRAARLEVLTRDPGVA